MSDAAYRGKEAIKIELLGEISRRLADLPVTRAERVRGEDSVGADFVETAMGASSRADAAEKFGLPAGFLGLLYALVRQGSGASKEGALIYLSDVFSAVTPGVNLSSTTSRFAKGVLMGHGGDVPGLTAPDGCTSVVAEVGALHGLLARGEMPTRAEWTASRKKAMGIADQHANNTYEHQVAEAAACAAWEPDQAPSSLDDLVAHAIHHHGALVYDASPWSPEDQTLEDGFIAKVREPEGGSTMTGDLIRETHRLWVDEHGDAGVQWNDRRVARVDAYRDRSDEVLTLFKALMLKLCVQAN